MAELSESTESSAIAIIIGTKSDLSATNDLNVAIAVRVQRQPHVPGTAAKRSIWKRSVSYFDEKLLVKLMAQLLSEVEINEQISQLSGWTQQGKEIHCQKTFKDFVEAIAWVNQLVDPAEAAGHHPDIAISYNKVTVSLTTHDAGGLTQMDFDLAQVISGL